MISQHDFGPFTNSDPVWSPDSRGLAFRTFEVGGLRSDIWQWTLGQPDASALRLLADGKDNGIDDWSPDSRFLLIRRDSKLALRLPLLPDATPLSVGDSEFAKDQLQLSPDGARVAYNTVMSGRPEVYVAAFPGFSGRTQISPAGGVQPLWRRDGQELFYIAADGTLMSVKGTNAPVTLFKPPSFTFTDSTSQYAVSADGQRFYVLETVSAPSDTLHVVTQWNAGLPR